MKILNQNQTIRDYRAAMLRGDIVINRDYQRSNQVWPDVARSYLMETIIRDFPIPKLFLHQTQDAQTKRPIKHIVDGQQRTQAIMDFCDGKFALSRAIESEDLRGLAFQGLDDEVREAFLDYGLSIDLFTAAPIEQVIEVFRRMNSYTVPLNPEEKRHANFQGAFKWFINRAAKQCQPMFRLFGTFTDKKLFRMADAKLLTEICHAIVHGIETTNSRMLDGLYKGLDKQFDDEAKVQEIILTALGEIAAWTELHGGPLMKPYQLYSLTLATAHVRLRLPRLQETFRIRRPAHISRDVAVPALCALAEAVEREDEVDDVHREFVEASTSKTNVKRNRELRFQYFCRALTGRDE
jgi:hypothetical protein